MEAKKDKVLSESNDLYKLILLRSKKHKSGIYIFYYKLSLKDETSKTFINAFDHMINYSIKGFPNGRIRIVPIHEIIFTKHKHWPIRTYDTVRQLFMEQMERLLNSAEEMNLDEVTFEVTIYPNKSGKGKGLKILNEINKRSIIQIKNNDTICLARAIITSLASYKLLDDLSDSQLKHIKEGRKKQETMAIDLHEKANVNIKEDGNDLDDLKDFEKYLKIRIIVFTSNSTEYILYKGNEEYSNQIYLYFHDEHFDVVSNITGFLAKRRFCKICLIGYTEQHTCKDNSVTSIRKQHICDKCNKSYTDKKHKCGEKKCFICYETYIEEHLCYMKPLECKKVKDNKYIYFDFEANQESGIHIMNFCIAYDMEYIYCFRKNYIQKLKCDFNINDIDLSKLDIYNCFNDIEKIEYESDSVINNFCKYFISDKFKNYTFLSHYGKGYDMQPILGWIIKNKIEHNFISSGLKITAIFIKGINLRFIDSINFTLCGLAAFPETFNFEGNKGYFPHYFNISKHQNYKGSYPCKNDYGYDTMPEKKKIKFNEWYYKILFDPLNPTFNFKEEIFYYCLLDVLILAKGCTIYKNLFLEITDNYIDPFQCTTIAQCCTKIFKTLILKEKTIGIHQKMTIKEVHSQKSIQWLEYICLKDNIRIQHAKHGGEKKLFINNKCYKLDGYHYDRKNSIPNVYEFLGCYWHGCPKCYSPEEICKKDRYKKTMKELYDKTIERLEIIKDYFQTKVNIYIIWECEFDQQKYPQVDPHLKPIDKRDAFYGGRTETIQLYNNLPNLKGKYVDFCSLYPTVNKYCEYPIGHPITYYNISIDEYLKNKYFGIVKCKILPPRGLYHPVLPYKQLTSDNTHKLLFGLCRTCMNRISVKCKHITKKFECKYDKSHAIKHCSKCKNNKNEKCNHNNEERVLVGTWSTIEINKAIEKGYQLQKIYELEHFEQTSTDIFKPYVNKFMKYKQEASGCKCDKNICVYNCKNDKDCETKIKYILDNTAYELNIDKVKYNAGLRFIAKICLNSLWGHFGMRDNFTQKEYCFNLEQIISIVFNEKYEDISTMILDEDIILTEYKNKQEYSKPNPSVNVYIALFTTAHARLKLYELLDILGERVMYLDSVTADTPVILRYNKKIIIRRIDQISYYFADNEYVKYGEKEISCPENLEVWTSSGWRKLLKVIKHKTNKKIYRVRTKLGIVDVTEDHSLLNEEKKEIKPEDLKINEDKLLHNNICEEIKPKYTLNNILDSIYKNDAETELEKKAFIDGFFHGDGSAGIYKYKSGIKRCCTFNNQNIYLLKKVGRYIQDVFNLDYYILDTMKSSSVYKMNIRNPLKIINRFVNFYNIDHKTKLIKDKYLNEKENIRYWYFCGFYAADGNKQFNRKYNQDIAFTQKGKENFAGLYLLASSLGIKMFIGDRDDKPLCFHCNEVKNEITKEVKKVKFLREGIEDVYDIETEDGTFNCGFPLIVKNTDSCIYHDDGSESCKKIESMMGKNLGDLTDEIVSKHKANYITQFISVGPKDYSMKLDTDKIVSCCKGFRLNAEVEEKITMDKKIKIVTNEKESYETIGYTNIKIGKDHQLKTIEQIKSYDYMFDKRIAHYENENLIKSLPYGF